MLVDMSTRAHLSSNFIYDLKVSINNTLSWYPWTRPDYQRNITISDINDIRAALWRRGNSMYVMYYYRWVQWGGVATYMGMDWFNEGGEPEWVWDKEDADYSVSIEQFNDAYNRYPESCFYQSQKPVFKIVPYNWSGCDPECFGDCEFCSESEDYRIHPGDILPGMPSAISITETPTIDREYSRVYVNMNQSPCGWSCQDRRHASDWLCALLDANPKTAFYGPSAQPTGLFLDYWTAALEWETYGLGNPLPNKEVLYVVQSLGLEQKVRA
jgi:hypothetical protein